MVFLTVFILGGIIILCVYYSSYKRNQKETSSHPMHFDLLDENGDPIKEPKIKVEVDNGNSDVPVQKLKYFYIKDKGHHVTVWPNDYDQFDIVEFNIAGMSHRDNIDNYLGEFIATL
jgi:hypothetical protein